MKVLILQLILSFISIYEAAELDPIALLASCGCDCWAIDPANTSLENITPGPESFDSKTVKCMQVCFSEKTKKEDHEQNLSAIQIKKIKVSAYCGYICYNNNKSHKKSLHYCYAGCLGSILQHKSEPKQK